jgi:putative transposase
MKTIYYSYKIRLCPTNEQKIKFAQHFGAVRWVYNYFLNQRKEYYQENKKSLNYNKQSSLLTQLKKEEETIWLKEINAQSLQYSLNCLEISYNNFFKKHTKFPQFKSKKGKNSFTVPQFFNIKNNILSIPKFREGIKMVVDRKIEGIIKHCTLSKTSTGKYFVSILVEKEYEPVQKTNKSVGIDLGLKDFLITSDGLKTKNHRYFKKYQKLLKINQQHLSRKQKDSKRREKQRLKVAKIYEKISNSRNDLIHKTTSNLIKNYDIIYLEDLNIKGMSNRCKPKQDENGKYLPNGQSAKSGLNKSINDVSWGKFIETLEYKAEWNDKQVVKINRWYPSSKTCNCCGWINQNLKLKDRTWACLKCNIILDRDLNAAKNILKEGIKITSVGTTDYGHGDQIRPDLSGTINEMSKVKILNIS